MSILERTKLLEKNKNSNNNKNKNDKPIKNKANDKEEDIYQIKKSQTFMEKNNPFIQMVNTKKSNNQNKNVQETKTKNEPIKKDKEKDNEKKEEILKTQEKPDNKNNDIKNEKDPKEKNNEEKSNIGKRDNKDTDNKMNSKENKDSKDNKDIKGNKKEEKSNKNNNDISKETPKPTPKPEKEVKFQKENKEQKSDNQIKDKEKIIEKKETPKKEETEKCLIKEIKKKESKEIENEENSIKKTKTTKIIGNSSPIEIKNNISISNKGIPRIANVQLRNSSTPNFINNTANSDIRSDSLESFDYYLMKDESLESEKTKKYNFKNIDKGKQYFKNRYIKEKMAEIEGNIQRMTLSGSIIDLNEVESPSRSSSTYKKTNNSNYEKESEVRKCQTEFLLIVEKAIISFNLKKYQESYTYLQSSGVIKDLAEFGEFLLVVSGFDKTIVGEFLAKEKPPNENKEILISFIDAIDMNYTEISFLECLRFLLTRLILPKDANLILVIMDTFSQKFFDNNKDDNNFIKIFNNTNAIYLLVSTILALNTMFTRKDIKNMNVIKKPEFKSMNKDIDESYVDALYDKLKKKPISLSEDYSEDIYRKLSTLVQVKQMDVDSKNLDNLTKCLTSEFNDKECSNNNKSDKNDINKKENNENKKEDNKEVKFKKNNTQKKMDQQYYDYVQDIMDLDIVRKTLRGNYYRKKSFSLNTNLLTFGEADKKLLSKPNKFYRINGSSTPTLREFLVYDDFKKLTFDKTIDINKKYKKFIEINDINDVFLGINHGDNIKKYIKAYPEEEKLVNNFISIVYNNNKEQIDIKTDDMSLALLWFKALKSLVIQTRIKHENKKIENEGNLINEIREIISLIWLENILPNWKNYAKFIIIKCYEKNNYFPSILTQPERQAKIDLLDEKKVLNAKTINDFLKEISDRLNKNQNNRLEYHEFFCLCYLGFPDLLRKKIWAMCIQNNLGITKKLYLYNRKEIMNEKLDFCKFDEEYKKDSNIQINPDYNLNKIIIDIIKSKYIFYQEIIDQELEENELMQKVYNITVIFNTIRSDIPYNKGIVSLAYFFLLTGLDEINSFKCISNLICSTNTIKYFISDKETKEKSVEFFKKLLKTHAEKVYDHLNKLEIYPELYFIPCLEKLFTQSLDFEILLHVFDLYIINGEYIMFQTAITIINLFEEDLLNLTISEVFKLLKRIPKKYTELDFFEKFKNYNNIKDEYVAFNKNNVLSLQQKEINKIIKK